MADITSEKDLEHWLAARPEKSRRAGAVALAARAAMRVVPLADAPGHASEPGLTSAVFRGTALARVAAVYPTRANALRAAATARAAATTPTPVFAATARAAAAAALAATADANADADEVAAVAALAAAAAAALAAVFVGTTRAAIWEAITADCTWLENGLSAKALAGKPLWLVARGDLKSGFGRGETPVRIEAAWMDMSAHLMGLGGDWHVWVSWYGAILAGRSPYPKLKAKAREDLDVAIVTLPDELWKSPAKVNAEIKRLIDEAHAKAEDDEAKQEKKEPAKDGELDKPGEPLPPVPPTVRFEMVNGKFDVARTDAWIGSEADADTYKARAQREIVKLLAKPGLGNVLPELKATLNSLKALLDAPFDKIDPHLLRLDSYEIADLAQLMEHPQSEWRTSDVESVRQMLSLSRLLLSLQGFVRQNLEENEQAVRELGLRTEDIATVKRQLDKVAEIVSEADRIVGERARKVFDDGRRASDQLKDSKNSITIEGQRILIVESLTIEVTQNLMSEEKPKDKSEDKDKKKDEKLKEQLAKAARKGLSSGVEKVAEEAVVETARGLGRAVLKYLDPLSIANTSFKTIRAWLSHELRRKDDENDDDDDAPDSGDIIEV